MWRRKGWAAMDQMREKLEGLKELRDLVRSLGRGGGWGPLRRAPVQASFLWCQWTGAARCCCAAPCLWLEHKSEAAMEGLKELRDLVRSLGRGGSWGPLRRAPVQASLLPVEAGPLAVSPAAVSG